MKNLPQIEVEGKPNYYFFIGTVAELIKVMPVMRELNARGKRLAIISTGQNPLHADDIFSLAGHPAISVVLNDSPVRKSPLGLLSWLSKTAFKGLRYFAREFRGRKSDATIIVHGDTVSTLLGAALGRLYRLRVAHIEAGLRSFNFMQPFPEELDRYLAAYFVDIHFCPNAVAASNLSRRRGIKVNTHYNTALDSLRAGLAAGDSDEANRIKSALGGHYFIFIMHRQENLLNKQLVRETIHTVLSEAETIRCLFVMHDLTKEVLREIDLLERIETNPNVLLSEKLPFLTFVSLLNACDFLVTDGGGNQQESFYLGKPCLILRNVTEGPEGIGENVVLGTSPDTIRTFFANHALHRREPLQPLASPTQIILEHLVKQ